MKCPYCNAHITSHKIDKNDGCCPECGAAVIFCENDDNKIIDNSDVEMDEENEITDVNVFGPTDVEEEMADECGYDDSPYERDEFDEFLEEEEKREREAIRDKRRKVDDTKDMCKAHKKRK